MCDGDDIALHRLVEHLQVRKDWQQMPLRELFPGLDLVESPEFLDRLSVRAMNCIVRAGAPSPSTLAAMTPASLNTVPDAGVKTVKEILAAVVREWASAYLGRMRGRTGVAPPPTDDTGPGDLALAFEELEAKRGFEIFARRWLAGDKRPTVRALAAERGLSPSRIGQIDAAIQGLLSKSMRRDGWPIRVAVEDLQGHLGSVARSEELTAAFSEVDPDGKALPDHMSQRRVLLLHLGGYRVSNEWILGPNIESITTVILEAVARDGTTDLDTVSRHLSRFGVRADLQLPWIVSRHGFRIIDGELVPLLM